MDQQLQKSRWQTWLNRFRVRLPLLLLVGLLIWAKPTWNLWGIPFLVLGEAIRTWAVGYIHKDRELATGGPYAFCRHPLYVGTLLVSVGVCVLIGSLMVGLIFAVVYLAVYIPTIRNEEDYLGKVYGDAYRDYANKVPAFVPTLRKRAFSLDNWSSKRLIRNEEHLTWAALLLFLLLMAAKQHFLL